MKLRRYGQFIKESVEVTDGLINLLVERVKFWNELMELDYSRFDFTYSYSDMCKRRGRNPEMDFEKIQKYLDEKGFTIEKLKNLFSEDNNRKCGYDIYELYTGDRSVLNKEPLKTIYKEIIFSKDYNISSEDFIQPFKVASSLDSQNAAIDVYLYFLFQKLGFKGVVWLGGDGWGNVHLEENDGYYTEAFIRYRYGYHQTEYGKLWMKQCQIDKDWFQEKAMDDLQRFLQDEFKDIVRRGSYRKKDVSGLNFGDYTIIEDDRIIFDLGKLTDDVNDIPSKDYSLPVEVEDIAAEFTKELHGFSLDIELTDGDDLIIWGRFKED